MNDPDRPGNIIPLMPIIPQKNINSKLSFSFAGDT